MHIVANGYFIRLTLHSTVIADFHHNTDVSYAELKLWGLCGLLYSWFFKLASSMHCGQFYQLNKFRTSQYVQWYWVYKSENPQEDRHQNGVRVRSMRWRTEIHLIANVNNEFKPLYIVVLQIDVLRVGMCSLLGKAAVNRRRQINGHFSCITALEKLRLKRRLLVNHSDIYFHNAELGCQRLTNGIASVGGTSSRS